MKTFTAFNEARNYEKMKPEKLIQHLERTRKSIHSFVSKVPAFSMNSRRAQELADRYGEIKDALRETEKGNDAWVAYCKKHGYDTTHNQYDMFA